MTDQTEQTTPAAVPAVLTLMVDMSHPVFARRGLPARAALATVLRGMASTLLVGTDATILEDPDGRVMGAMMIGADESGEGKVALTMLEQVIRRSLCEIGAAEVSASIVDVVP